MMPVRIAIVVGTRPEAIKMAPVYLALKAEPGLEVSLITTAQHRQMLDQVCVSLGMEPDIDLNLMRNDQSLSEITAKVTVGVQKVLAEMKPDAVLVHGDTTTCLCSALAAFYERIPVGHVEAGLRTYNFEGPWPEEMNRRLTDPISRWCFAPTQRAADNLRAERIDEKNIFVTGNTVIDSLLMVCDMVRRNKPVIGELPNGILDEQRLILVTGHRRESFGKPFKQFCFALRDIVRSFPDTILVYPVHLNPNVKRPVKKILGGHDRIYLIDPLEYPSFVYLLDRSYLIITDSGGIQEEAPSLHKPVLVTRQETERPEAVEMGMVKLVGTCREKIVSEASRLLTDAKAYSDMAKGDNPYGDGQASKKIVNILSSTM